MTDQRYAISMEDVYVRYPKPEGGAKTVLNDIDLRVSAGELITVVGHSGCGKSTLLKLILGSERATAGKVQINGLPVRGPDRHRGIVYQKYSLLPHLTVLENIAFGLDLEGFNLTTHMLRKFTSSIAIDNGLKRRVRKFREEAQEYLKRIDLAGEGSKYPDQLSGGMQQRVAIARAMIMRSEVLLMDEPFGALDEATRESMQLFLLEQWASTKMTIFFVTHSLEEALFLGTRIIVLSSDYKTDIPSEGSKIVIDKAVPESHNPKFKYTPQFTAMMEQIRKRTARSQDPLHISQFDLSHPDAFRTVTTEEWRHV